MRTWYMNKAYWHAHCIVYLSKSISGHAYERKLYDSLYQLNQNFDN